MIREDIVRMAREAGAIFDDDDCLDDCAVEIWARFAALVATAEREACALVCETIPAAWPRMDDDEICMECARAIRARGNV